MTRGTIQRRTLTEPNGNDVQLLGRCYNTGHPVRLDLEDGRIVRSAPLDCTSDEKSRFPWIAPGLIDLQVNGYGGHEFSSATLSEQKVITIGRAMSAMGVTRFCPTVTTESGAVLTHAMRTIDSACHRSAELARQVIGIHLEGPYLCREDGPRGAHPLAHCREPDWDEFQRLQEAAGGRIRLLTMAVEFDTAPAFIEKLVTQDIVVGIGHTAGSESEIGRAIDAGARLSTHLGNGGHPILHRHHNYLWPQLADDRLVASLIVDSHHLPSAVVKTFVRAKTPSRCLLVSDLSGQAGQPPGRYRSDFCDVEILPDGRLVIAGQCELMAGASFPIGAGIAGVMHHAEVDLKTAIDMAVAHPAKLLGIESGGLRERAPGDLVLFDLVPDPNGNRPARFDVRATISGGKLVFGKI